jgi:hypothetical protein
MKARGVLGSLGLLSMVLLAGCSPSTSGEESAPPPTGAAIRADVPATALERVADDPPLLPRPFTADQIRDEWVVGYEVTWRRWTPDNETRERWQVVAADAEGVDIASTPLDADGGAAGEPRVEHSTWTDLRDHASFPEDHATREMVTRATPLGELEGWLYTVRGPKEDTVTEYFFANRFPGAPVLMRVELGGVPVMIMEQVARSGAQHTPS